VNPYTGQIGAAYIPAVTLLTATPREEPVQSEQDATDPRMGRLLRSPS
jgi:hypothetical protein